MYTIQKNLSIPTLRSTHGVGDLPLRDLKIGESFFLSKEDPDFTFQRLRGFASIYGRAWERKFTCRITIENDIQGMRIWRVPAA